MSSSKIAWKMHEKKISYIFTEGFVHTQGNYGEAMFFCAEKNNLLVLS